MFNPLAFIRRNGVAPTVGVKAHGYTLKVEGALPAEFTDKAVNALLLEQTDRIPISGSGVTESGVVVRVKDSLSPLHAAQFVRGVEDSPRVKGVKDKLADKAADAGVNGTPPVPATV